MKQNRWKKIEKIFYEAVALSPEKRTAFVEEKCGGNDELCREILALLLEDSENRDFLNEPIFNDGLHLLRNDFSGLLKREKFSHYKLLGLLGRGGMGAVFLARDLLLERDIALKILPPEFAENEQSVQRFRQEARAASAVSHPGIAHIYEFGEVSGRYFLAMEFVEGKTLREMLKEKRIDVFRALEIARQIADALVVMHRRGIVHRDIKPENIIITENNFVKILDFGLAKLNAPPEDGNQVSLETTPGMIVGTTAYMSPEQVRGQNLDGRSDLWSLGVLLFEMLASQRPFAGETASDVQAAILLKDARLVLLPTETASVVGKLLKKNADERYQTANEFLTDLHNARNDLETSKKNAAITAPEIDTGEKSNLPPTFKGNFNRYNSRFAFGTMLILLAIIGIGYWSAGKNPSGFAGTSPPIKSIAVLPFVNESDDEEKEYLSDGLTESLIFRLSQLPELTVTARNSVFHFKDKNPVPKTVGEQLSVETVLYGRINEQNEGGLTLSLELIDVLTGRRLWSEQYKQKSANFVALQNEIALDVSHKIKTRLSAENERQLSKKFTENAEAYKLYLKGRFHWNKRTAKDLVKSVGYFEQAVRLDPDYALAYAGLADSYVLLSGYGAGSPQESFPKAKDAARKALEIDETLAAAHASLGYALFNYDWNFEESEKEMRRAVELNPGYATAYHWYGNANLLAAGKLEESIEALKRAHELDPLSLIINADLATAYLYADQIDNAVEQYRKTIELDENFYYAHAYLGRTYMMKGDYPNALAEFQKAQTLNDDPRILMLFACTYSRMKKRGDALKMLDKLNRTARERFVSPYYFALVYTALGDKNKAFDWLEKAYQEREGRMTLMKVDPLLADLHSDVRFQDLLKRVGQP